LTVAAHVRGPEIGASRAILNARRCAEHVAHTPAPLWCFSAARYRFTTAAGDGGGDGDGDGDGDGIADAAAAADPDNTQPISSPSAGAPSARRSRFSIAGA
jgi:hypothetical protein